MYIAPIAHPPLNNICFKGNNAQNPKPQTNGENFDELKRLASTMPIPDYCMGAIFKDKNRLDSNIHYINMDFYARLRTWANKMNISTYVLADMIKYDFSFEDVLTRARLLVSNMNKDMVNSYNYFAVEKEGERYVHVLKGRRGREYVEKYFSKLEKAKENLPENYLKKYLVNGYQIDELSYFYPKSNKEYKNAKVCRVALVRDYIEGGPTTYVIITTPPLKEGKDNIALATREYDKLKTKENPTLDEINHSVATIHWLIAQQMPYERGSDSIANLISKSIYHSYGINVFPYKKGISADFEAYYSDLDDFVKNYPTFFTKPPVKY